MQAQPPSTLRYELFCVAMCVAVVAFFSTLALTESPGVWYDEGYYLQLGLNQERHGMLGLQVAPGQLVSAGSVTVGYPLIYPLSLVFTIFGEGVLQARALMAAFILAFVIAGYILIRSLFGWRTAVVAAAVLGSFPLLYGNGKSVLGEVPGLLYLTLFLYGLATIERAGYRRPLLYAISGALAGLCIATKPLFVLLVPALLLALFIKRKTIDFKTGNIALAVVSGGAALLLWLVTQFSLADSAQEVFGYYANPYEVDVLAAVAQNALRFVSEATPMHFLLVGLVWTGSLIVRARRRTEVSLAELTAAMFALCVLLAYLRTAGWYRYFFPGHAIALLFLPAAVEVFVARFAAHRPYFRRIHVAWIAGALLAPLVLLQLYQLAFRSWVADSYARTDTAQLEGYFGALEPHTSFFLYNVPEVAIHLPGPNYYQYLHPVGTLMLGKSQLDVLSRGGADRVVVSQEDYTAEAALFSQYVVQDEVAGYLILAPVSPAP